MSEMELNEIKSRFDESLKRAVSRAKELAIALKQPLYNNWATSLDRMRVQGIFLAESKSRTKLEVESDIARIQNQMNIGSEVA